MSDELTRAITEALGCKESSFYGVVVCVAHGPGWPCRKAEDVADALAPLIEARVREARAEAWDETAEEAYGWGWLHGGALADVKGRNPYRED